jgi:two-component system OmpR family response regulator
MPMNQILMIDDDKGLAEPLQTYFERYALSLDHAELPDQGIQMLRDKGYDLLVLDIMLPGKDGFEVCKEVRAFSDIPIVMLTARGEVTDRIVGIELGADDYLPKPFDPRELVARISRILKRGQSRSVSKVKFKYGQLEVDTTAKSATLDGATMGLTGHEFMLLEQFCKSGGAMVSRDDIMNNVNGVEAELFSRSVDVLVSRLRQKLKPLEPISTFRGKGYQWILGADK